MGFQGKVSFEELLAVGPRPAASCFEKSFAASLLWWLGVCLRNFSKLAECNCGSIVGGRRSSGSNADRRCTQRVCAELAASSFSSERYIDSVASVFITAVRLGSFHPLGGAAVPPAAKGVSTASSRKRSRGWISALSSPVTLACPRSSSEPPTGNCVRSCPAVCESAPPYASLGKWEPGAARLWRWPGLIL